MLNIGRMIRYTSILII